MEHELGWSLGVTWPWQLWSRMSLCFITVVAVPCVLRPSTRDPVCWNNFLFATQKFFTPKYSFTFFVISISFLTKLKWWLLGSSSTLNVFTNEESFREWRSVIIFSQLVTVIHFCLAPPARGGAGRGGADSTCSAVDGITATQTFNQLWFLGNNKPNLALAF